MEDNEQDLIMDAYTRWLKQCVSLHEKHSRTAPLRVVRREGNVVHLGRQTNPLSRPTTIED